MSGVSALAQEYRAVSQLSEAMNRALIGLKKSEIGSDVDQKELARARAGLADIVLALETAVASANEGSLRKSSSIPVPVINSVLRRRRGQLDYFLEDLRRVRNRLVNGVRVEPEDLRLLDEIVGAVDVETAHVFRRLMRK